MLRDSSLSVREDRLVLTPGFLQLLKVAGSKKPRILEYFGFPDS